GLKPKNKIATAFGSYGWGRGAVKAINKELKEAGFEVIESGLEIKYRPDEDGLKKCYELGKEIAIKVKNLNME
ncbi:MAG: flavodoxin domain-containing protein, partial [Methanosarcinales archaeon]